MVLEVFYLQDIRNALASVELATNAALEAARRTEPNAYINGYKTGCAVTLQAVARAFGLLQTADTTSGHDLLMAVLPGSNRRRR